MPLGRHPSSGDQREFMHSARNCAPAAFGHCCLQQWGSGLQRQLCKHSCSADFLNQEGNFGVPAFQVPSLMQGAEGWSGHSRRPEQLKTGSVPPGTDVLFLEDGLQVQVTLKMIDDFQE